MTTFPISIQVSNSGAKSAIGGVTTALKGAENAGAAAGKAIGDGLDKASVSGQKAIASAKLLGQSLAGIATAYVQQGLGGVAKSFAGLNEQLEREARLFDGIRGPMREYEANLQSLAMLHKRGTINAREYAQAVADQRAAVDHGGSVSATKADSGTSFLGKAAVVGGTALAAGYAATKVLGEADDYTNLQKKLGGVSRSMGDASASAGVLYDKLYDVAQLTGSDVGATVDGFARMSIATKEMGLEQSRVIGIQSTLSKFIATSGVSAEGASTAMTQLGQALASGRLQGDEFRSMSENFPEMLSSIATQLGVTTGQLRQMSSEGQLTSSVLIHAFEGMKDSVDKNFDESEKTFASRWQRFKNFMSRVVGEGAKYTSTTDRLDALDAAAQSTIDKGYAAAVKSGDFSGFAGHDDQYQAAKQRYDIKQKELATQQQLNGHIDAFNAKNKTFLDAFQKEASIYVDARAGAAAYGVELDKLEHARRVAIEQQRDAGTNHMPLAASENAEMAAMQGARRLSSPGMGGVLDLRDQAGKITLELAQLRREYDLGKVSVDEYSQVNAQLTKSLNGLVDPLARVHEAEERRRASAAAGAGPALDVQDQIDDTREKLKQLAAAHGQTGVSATAEYVATKQLTDQLMSLTGAVDYYKKVLDDIRQPGIDFRGSMGALNAMFKANRVSGAEYLEEFEKLNKAYYGAKGYQAFIDLVGEEAKRWDAATDAAKKHQLEIDKNVDKAFAGGIGWQGGAQGEGNSSTAQDKLVASTRMSFFAADSTQRSEMEALDTLLKQHTIDAKQYASAVDEVRMAYLRASDEGKTFAGGAEIGWLQIKSQATDVAGAIESAMTNAYKGVEDALVSLIATGKADWKSLVDGILADLARLAIRQAVAGAASGDWGSAIAGIAGAGGIAGLGAILRTGAQPVTPQLPSGGGSATSTGAVARTGGTTVIINQDKDALLKTLGRGRGPSTVANVVMRDTGIAKAIRGRHGS